MNKESAFNLFNEMIAVAESELYNFTMNSDIAIESKTDKSLVTACDKAIDKKLSGLAIASGFQVVSEEGPHMLDIVRSENYLTIDPIDGTLGYLDYVNYAVTNGGIGTFGSTDLGAQSDFALLLGIVENNIPKFAAVYNYITKEKILVSSDPIDLVRENNVRNYTATNCFYLDQRMSGELESQVKLVPDVTSVVQAAIGLKSIYTIINPHQNAVTIHRVQSAGLWDIMPAAVAARAYAASIYDDKGEDLKLNEYIILPGKGATIIKGNLFDFVPSKLKAISSN